ncbi:helix-turn-helix domain-containing protein [Rhizobium laguerreae]|nr:helix-turn-helix domain-containing protein [Rhizobium laguerreae]MBY3184163.1 helix-turn-helix domain-containing protein [Rhizobium laguerreae]TBZ36595.1 DNA-binding protein [Rhizobium leguminosarum bv. viciae]
MPEFMTIAELAKMTRSSVPTVYANIKRGAGPKITKIGGKTLFERRDIEAWIASAKTDRAG